jgi:prophage regulatory protein
VSTPTTNDAAQRRIGIAQVRLRTNSSTSTINRWIRAGSFPRPHYLGVRRCWLEAEVIAWLEERMAATIGG